LHWWREFGPQSWPFLANLIQTHEFWPWISVQKTISATSEFERSFRIFLPPGQVWLVSTDFLGQTRVKEAKYQVRIEIPWSSCQLFFGILRWPKSAQNFWTLVSDFSVAHCPFSISTGMGTELGPKKPFYRFASEFLDFRAKFGPKKKSFFSTLFKNHVSDTWKFDKIFSPILPWKVHLGSKTFFCVFLENLQTRPNRPQRTH